MHRATRGAFNMKINERFLWALSVLSPSPEDQILEIGCGNGILTEQIANRLDAGCITAIDRSAPAIKQAEKRNAENVNEGVVKLITSDFSKASFAQHQFDKILAFNVNIFWKGSDNNFQLIRHCLKPTGQLYVFYETPSWSDPKIERKIKMLLEVHNFTIQDTTSLKHPACICIFAT
jgi:ubiquinone/menaquinone biosynthesis C-methylase UbiE